MKKLLYIASLAVMLLSACKTPNVSYFQNVQDGDNLQSYQCPPVTMRPGDQITIFVKSIRPEITQMFNLTMGTTSTDQANNQRAYTVDSEGKIFLPSVGSVHVAGLTREQVAAAVKKAIEDKGQAKDVTVIVDFKNMYFAVSGEVARPGRYEFNKDHITLLEALSMAGDVNIAGMRENILVIRQEGDVQKAYRVNITNSDSIVNSPAFQTRPGDYIYVTPTQKRQRETTVNGNTMMTPGFWISIASFLTTLITLFVIK